MSLFIVLEGLDGVGKSTLAQRYAQQHGYLLMTTPGRDIQPIRAEIINGLGNSETAKALFYAATVQAEGEKAYQLVEKGESVLMDRYRASTLAYAYQRNVTLNLSAVLCQTRRPHLSILLTLDEQQRQERLQQRGATAEDIETLNPEFRDGVLNSLQAECDVTLDLTGANEEKAVALLRDCICNQLRM
ncbi:MULTISPECIES: AAA family ATPase [unclassified Oceanobacter]|uniref:AAA family ATPase n=1 Tax=unclassified Oceanobacter TaxID=2620260 RepID=UPI00273487E1|nr:MULTISPECIES: AAA family ATPase [unclassified Oceanobacter]MDP2505578.1 AAA family ATPase [Oceanobacter sp. 3_MG-2023]MDP2547160.1 AAA family ATPase [Oceanobacter sp. 4_MG-2023]